MKNLIDSFIRFLINSIIILALIGLCILVFLIIFSQTNQLPIQESISYVTSFASENIIHNVSTPISKEKFNILSDSSNSSNQPSINSSTPSNSTAEPNFYYYQQLDTNGKLIYKTLYQERENLKKENYTIDFGKQFNSLLNEPGGQETLNVSFQSALDAFFYDHPEFFYLDLTKISLYMKYTSIGPITTYTVSLVPTNHKNYLHDAFPNEESVDKAIQQVEEVKHAILQQIHTSDSTYQKMKIIHDSLVKMLQYDTSSANMHTLYGALVEKKAVCEGYAKAFKYILDSLNIDCILVCGTATNSNNQSESHMWNYVEINHSWYGVDVTWDDPIIIGGFSRNNLRHTYFCQGSSSFSSSHTPSGYISTNGQFFKLPALSYNNYKK